MPCWSMDVFWFKKLALVMEKPEQAEYFHQILTPLLA